MPELPEVEVICRGIRPHLLERVVTGVVTSGKLLRSEIPLSRMQRYLVNRRITTVTRRAKYLQIGLDSGAMLLIHLGMTGNLGFFPPAQAPAKHDHVRWLLDNGLELRFNDTRRFGAIHVLAPDEVRTSEETVFRTTGPEPFGEDFTAEYLLRLASGREAAVKSFIMTNQVVAGVGNIYANESLCRAGIRPDRKVRSLSLQEWARLISAIREILGHAIACGGSTISDFINAGRERGYFQINFKVYGKNGTACAACGTAIVRKTIGGRASFYCPTCQS